MQFANPIKPIKKHNFKHSEKTQNTADPTNHAKNSYMGCAVIFLFSRGSGENQRKNKTADPMNHPKASDMGFCEPSQKLTPRIEDFPWIGHGVKKRGSEVFTASYAWDIKGMQERLKPHD